MRTKKKVQPQKHRRNLSNKSLLSLTILVLGLVILGTLVSLAVNRSRKDQLKVQIKNLGAAITGNGNDNKSQKGKPAEYVYIPILMYHHVGPLPSRPDAVRRDMTVPTDNFELQVAWLKGQGYQTITLNDLLEYSKGDFQLPEKPVIFTFDDGYSDVFDNAVPTLLKYGFTGTFAIITQFPGITQGTNSYATWQQIKQAQKEGMEIVSHTQDHFDGTNRAYDRGFILRNLVDSQADLKSNLGSALPILIYPFGHYNAEYINLAKQAGFELALTTKFGQKLDMKNLMELPRVRVHGNVDLETFKRLIEAGDKAMGDNGY